MPFANFSVKILPKELQQRILSKHNVIILKHQVYAMLHGDKSFLTPPQQEVLAKGFLSSGFSCVLQMPTGAGKTWLAERTIAEVLSAGHRAVYLSPIRALAQELHSRWSATFSNTKVGIFTGDYGQPGSPFPVPLEDARLMIMTPERLDACTRNWRNHWRWIPKVELVVVDELHLLGDGLRGARLEGTLSRFRRLNPFARFVGLSATLGNRSEIADWLWGVEYGSKWRPVPLTWRVVRYRKADEKPGLLLQECQHTLDSGGRTLVFVQSRRRAEDLSRILVSGGLPAAHHHAGLDFKERSAIECRFRSSDLKVLVATATLEMGLNLPARQVVLYDLQGFDGRDFRPLAVNTVWQRVGRAGRLGFDDKGEGVLLAPSWDQEASRYERGSFEPIQSQLTEPAALAEQIIVDISTGLSRTRSELQSALQETLVAHQKRLTGLDAAVAEMLTARMLSEDDRADDDTREVRLRTTPLGRIAVRHMLNPGTVRLLEQALSSVAEPTLFDLLLLVCVTPDCEPIIPADYEELGDLAAAASRERSTLLGSDRSSLTELLAAPPRRILAGIKMALVARHWTQSGDVERIALEFGCYPFELRRLTESVGRLLSAAAEICRAIRKMAGGRNAESKEPSMMEQKIRLLAAMVTHGIDEEVGSLMLVDGIGPAWAKRLSAAGVGDLEELAVVDPRTLTSHGGLRLERANQWIDQAEKLIKSEAAYLFCESIQACLATTGATRLPKGVDPYRLKRALQLSVTETADGYVVIGGLDPHQVFADTSDATCDCPDFAQGHQCKHVLAVRIHAGDSALKGAAELLGGKPGNGHHLDLVQLWGA